MPKRGHPTSWDMEAEPDYRADFEPLYGALASALGSLAQEPKGTLHLVDDTLGDWTAKIEYIATPLAHLQEAVLEKIQSTLRRFPKWRLVLACVSKMPTLHSIYIYPDGMYVVRVKEEAFDKRVNMDIGSILEEWNNAEPDPEIIALRRKI